MISNAPSFWVEKNKFYVKSVSLKNWHSVLFDFDNNNQIYNWNKFVNSENWKLILGDSNNKNPSFVIGF